MLVTTALSCFLAFWSLLFLIDFYLRTYDVKAYVNFADRIGLTVSFFHLRFYTNRFHHSLLVYPLSSGSPERYSLFSRLLSVWFAVGAGVALCCLLGTTLYLTKLFGEELSRGYFALFSARQVFESASVPIQLNSGVATPTLSSPPRSENRAGLIPVVPGVNVPWDHVPLFLVVLVVAGVVHELGHALAAVDANVPVNGFGIFLYFVYPGAFTEIETEALGRSTAAQKMRIFGAGIWHNLILALFGFLLLISAPWILSPLYSRDNGVLIRGVSRHSGLSGAAGLRRGHVVYAINGCGVRNSRDWYACVRELKFGPKLGYCIPHDSIAPSIATKVKSIDGEMHCCEEFSNVSMSHICFHFNGESATEHAEIRPQVKDDAAVGVPKPPSGLSDAPLLAESLGLKNRKLLSNLNRQPVIETKKKGAKAEADGVANSLKGANLGGLTPFVEGTLQKDSKESYVCLHARFVTDHEPCRESITCGPLAGGSPNRRCVFPALYNGTTLLRFFIGNSSRPVLFIGSVDELSYYVEIDDFVPIFFFAPASLPGFVSLSAKYLITFSLAMALLNAVPCFGLDGQFISTTLVERIFEKRAPSERRLINSLLLYYGTFVLAGNVVVGFFRFFSSYFSFAR